MKLHTMELGAGECIELIEGRGPNDGRLAGYVIKFTDTWDAWVWSATYGTMRRLLVGVSREEAIDGIKQHLE